MFLKRFVMVFVISFLASNLFAQGSYFSINTGYGFSTSSQNISFLDINFYNQSSNNDNNTPNTYEQVNVSLGKGFDIGGTYGYMFNENFGAEIGVSYLIGSQYKTTKEYNIGTMYEIADYTLSSNMLRFNPSIVIASGFEKFNPYAKFGMIIGTGSIMYKKKQHIMGSVTNTKTELTMKFNGGITLGLSSNLGVMYELNNKMSLFGEAKMINLSYAPDKGKTTEYFVDGEDRLSDLTTREKEVDFVDSYTENYGGVTPPESEPRKELKQKFPYGSLSINVGFMLSL